ncbi:hypothetical protein [Fodinicola feengrottensis]|uniref:hypothetical protein n=1 Tax=Fodinicola feengrottensis TaxID=435914 RepID=UPI0024430CC5|nr:hypothetical protein [Fodinicola feengrottensis]
MPVATSNRVDGNRGSPTVSRIAYSSTPVTGTLSHRTYDIVSQIAFLSAAVLDYFSLLAGRFR